MADGSRYDELMACLEALAEYVDQTPEDDAEIYNSEHLTACWQTCELVMALLQEHNELLVRIKEFNALLAMAKAEAAQKATGLVIAQSGDMRKYIAEQGG